MIARRLGVAASIATGWRRYCDFPASAQTAADRHLDAVAEVDAWHAQHAATPGTGATQAT